MMNGGRKFSGPHYLLLCVLYCHKPREMLWRMKVFLYIYMCIIYKSKVKFIYKIYIYIIKVIYCSRTFGWVRSKNVKGGGGVRRRHSIDVDL